MALASYFGQFDVDAETNRVLDVALEMTRAALGLADDFANGIIARQIVELARAGERNPNLLCEGALKKLRGALFGSHQIAWVGFFSNPTGIIGRREDDG